VKIFVECEFEVDYHEYNNNGHVKLETLTFPGCTQNLLPFMSESEQALAQQFTEDEVAKLLEAELAALRERKEMRADIARDFQRETLAELAVQGSAR